MNSDIFNSIKNKQRLQFEYHGKVRIVEPQCYGLSTKGKETLRAYQINPTPPANKLFTLEEINSLKVLTNDLFQEPGPGYRKHDSAMNVIFCEL